LDLLHVKDRDQIGRLGFDTDIENNNGSMGRFSFDMQRL